MVKINHNELLTYPNKFDQIMFGPIKEAWNMGAVAVGATVYFGSDQAPARSWKLHRLSRSARTRHGDRPVVLHPHNAFKVNGINYETAADLTGQANHLGATIQADILKQKLPETNGGFKALNTGGSSYGKLDERIYSQLTSDHPIDLTRYQVANGYMGRIGLISSGGASGDTDVNDAIKTAVVNKRAGGTGLISGRKAFQRPMDEGAALLRAIQDVYLNEDVTIA